MFPDPRRRHPCFEFPGSTRAGPPQVALKQGPLPEGIVGFVLGRSSLSFQKISVVYGVVDSDYIGEIKVLISPSTKTVQINKGLRVNTAFAFTLSDRKKLDFSI